MPSSQIRIAPYLRVLIADSDPTYCAALRTRLDGLGFARVDETARPAETLRLMRRSAYDIVMVEVADGYQPVWDHLAEDGPGASLIVGMSLDRSGRDWIAAIQDGADAILMKAFHTHLLQPVLAHMLASPAAHRGRIVQFPRPETSEIRAATWARRVEGLDAERS